MSIRRTFILSVLVLLGNCVLRAASYGYMPINVPGIANTPAATGINGSGDIVGYYSGSQLQGFLDHGGQFTTISVAGYSGTQPLGINNAGQVVGTFLTNIGGRNAFVYGNGVATPLSVLGSGFAEATGINDSGQIVGYYGAASEFAGFLDSNGTFTTLSVPGSSGTEAFGINRTGQVVGVYLDSVGAPHPFLYSNGGFTLISGPNGTSAYATGINDQGQIAGYYSSGSGFAGFVDTNGTFATLSFPGSAGTEAFGLNNAGQIAGMYFDQTGGSHAFLATPIPEPASLLLLSIAALMFLVARFRCTQ